MKVKMLRSVYGNEGHVKKGEIVDVTDDRAKSLINRNLAVALPGQKPLKAAPQKKGAAAKSGANPSTARPAGGQTGGGRSPSSSPEDPRRAKRRSRKQKAARD